MTEQCQAFLLMGGLEILAFKDLSFPLSKDNKSY